MTPPYVELHCHSAYSFLDGASMPDELVPAAHALAARIAANPPLAVRTIKEGLRLARGRRVDELQDVATFVGHSLAHLFSTDDHKEAAAAFVERRTATFTGR